MRKKQPVKGTTQRGRKVTGLYLETRRGKRGDFVVIQEPGGSVVAVRPSTVAAI